MNSTKDTFDLSGFLSKEELAQLSIRKQTTNKKSRPMKNPQKELSDEIKSFRDKAKQFAATNDHETYLIVVFSTKEDKQEFVNNTGVGDDSNTIVDGYKLSAFCGVSPTRPKFKLKAAFKE